MSRPTYDDLLRHAALSTATLRELLRLLAAADAWRTCVVDLDEGHGDEWAALLRKVRAVIKGSP